MIQLMLAIIMTLVLTLQGDNANKPIAQQTSTSDIPTIEFCQLNGQYENKVVRVRALYRSGFEESSLYSPKCYIPNLVWVKFDPSHRLCTKKSVQKKLDNIKDGQSVDVIFIGRYETKGDGAGGYGHMDMYVTQFVVTCVEDVKRSGRFRPLPDEKK